MQVKKSGVKSKFGGQTGIFAGTFVSVPGR